MEQSFPTIISPPQPSLGARLTSPETQGAAKELARLGAGLGLAALYGLALGARHAQRSTAGSALEMPGVAVRIQRVRDHAGRARLVLAADLEGGCMNSQVLAVFDELLRSPRAIAERSRAGGDLRPLFVASLA